MRLAGRAQGSRRTSATRGDGVSVPVRETARVREVATRSRNPGPVREAAAPATWCLRRRSRSFEHPSGLLPAKPCHEPLPLQDDGLQKALWLERMGA